MTYQVSYEGIEIEYTLHRKNVKYINLRINKKGEIIVSAPHAVPLQTIHDFVTQKASWIILHIAQLEKIQKSAPWESFRDGKTLYVLGQPYRLIIANGRKNYVLPGENGVITIFSTPAQDRAAIYKTYMHWLRQTAIVKFADIMDAVHPIVAPLEIKRPVIQIRNMRTLWGSCTTTGNSIRLNLQLIKAPERCIEQVILHELLHFRYPKHNKEFYEKMLALMPDYQSRKQELDTQYKDGVI